MLQKTRRLSRMVTGIATVLCLGAGLNAQEISLRDLEQAANAGNTAAQMRLGNYFNSGINAPQNFVTARYWFERAAQAGNADAQNQFGRYLRSGLGGRADPDAAVMWLQKAADAGHPTHIFDLAQMYEQGAGVKQNYAKAAMLYAQASAAGNIEAAVSLGVLYQNGTGVAQDYERAFQLYQGPAQAGHARAQNNLGLLYVRGTGVAQNYPAAAEWFNKAAQAGLATAMTNLGVLYENGFGVAQSDEEAAKWYRKGGQNKALNLQNIEFLLDPRIQMPDATPSNLQALQGQAAQGDPIAQFTLAYLLLTKSDGHQARRQAAHWFEQSATAGVPYAMANLGLMYHRGLGVVQDYVVGQMWLTLAASANTSDLVSLRDAFVVRITLEQLQEAQAMAQIHWKHNQK